MTYQDYKTQFYNKRPDGYNSQPMDEKTFNEMMGIKDDNFHEPFLARKRSSIKHVKPALEVHINAS